MPETSGAPAGRTAGAVGVLQPLFRRLELLLVAQQIVLGIGDRMPAGGKPGVVSGGLERRKRHPREGEELAEVEGGRVEREQIAPLLKLCECLAATITGGLCPLDRRRRDRLGFGEPGRAEERVGEIEVESCERRAPSRAEAAGACARAG